MSERTSLGELERLVTAAFERAGVPAAHATLVARVLVEAEARGIGDFRAERVVERSHSLRRELRICRPGEDQQGEAGERKDGALAE